jgi:peptide/nickel transport system permease protein
VRKGKIFLFLQSPYRQDISKVLSPPDADHILGTDLLGRDVFSRVFFSSYRSVLYGLIATLVALILGVFVGGFFAFKGGVWDKILVLLFEFFFSLPLFFLLIIIASLFNNNKLLVWIMLGIAGWTIPGRYMRGEVLKVKGKNFITVAKSLGASDFHILKFHLLPLTITPVLVVSVFNLASMILLESSLSFLGIGITPPNPSWGNMIADGVNYIDVAPWTFLPASIMLFLTVLSLDIISVELKKKLQNSLN